MTATTSMTTAELPSPATARWRGGRLSRSIVFAVLLLIAFAILAPFAYVGLASFQVTGRNGYSSANWSTLVHSLPLARDMVNSAILAVGTALCTIVICSLAGFAFAKLPFRGSQTLLFCAVATIAIPVISVIVPEYVNASKVNLLGSYPATILIYTAFNSGLAVFFLSSYFRGLPDSLMDSALVDGAGYSRIYFGIILPLSTPALVTVGVLIFIIVWNDLLVALLFMPDASTHTISVGLASLASQHSENLGPIMAGSIVSAVPTVLVYIFFQRYLVSGLTMGVDR